MEKGFQLHISQLREDSPGRLELNSASPAAVPCTQAEIQSHLPLARTGDCSAKGDLIQNILLAGSAPIA